MEIIKNGFKNERLGIELDVYVIDGKEWFKDSDIASFLEYRDSFNMKRSIDFLQENSIPRFTRNGYEAHYINEMALYEAVLKIRNSETDEIKKSRYAKAREFQKWVFSEVLPSLRENGIYAEQNITSQQLESYVKENENLRTAIKNYSAGVADSKNLNRYLTKRFPNIKDAYNQILVEFKRIGILGDDMLPTEKFKVSNQKEKWITYSVNISSDEKIAIILTSKGINIMSKIIHEEDGRIVLRKFESSI